MDSLSAPSLKVCVVLVFEVDTRPVWPSARCVTVGLDVLVCRPAGAAVSPGCLMTSSSGAGPSRAGPGRCSGRLCRLPGGKSVAATIPSGTEVEVSIAGVYGQNRMAVRQRPDPPRDVSARTCWMCGCA
jgi:hypothetical protein